MAVQTFTKAGNKATAAVKLDKSVFAVDITNHELLKQAYVAYLANGRTNNAVALKRGEVRGGGRKPWRQKGTGRARFGSIRTPIWRGGGITFGPTGEENYTKKLSMAAKRQALRQALSLRAKNENLAVIESLDLKEGRTKVAANLLSKLGVTGRVLIVVKDKTEPLTRATRNLKDAKVVQADYLNVYDVLNADTVLMTQEGLAAVHARLGGSNG